jgi:hypothetical protein
MLVGFDSAFADLDGQRLQAEALRDGFPPGAQQHPVAGKLLLCAVLLHRHPARPDGGHLGLQAERNAAALQILQQEPGDLRVHAARHLGQLFHHGDGAAGRGEIVGHFQADNAAADDKQFFGQFPEGENAQLV